MPRIFAHRGSSGRYAENTRAAFMQAIQDGADGLECDVRLTADGEVVVHHDAKLGRTSNGSGPVSEHSLAQLRGMDFSNWKNPSWPAEYGGVREQLLTLDDLLDIAEAAGRPIEVAIEVKHTPAHNPALDEAVLAIVEARSTPSSLTFGNVSASIMSFSPTSVRRMIEVCGAEKVCMLIENKRLTKLQRSRQNAAMKMLNETAQLLAGPGVSFIRAHEEHVRRWIRQGTKHRVWTVDTLEDAHYLLDLGVEELTGNYPAELRQALQDAPTPTP